MPEAATPPLALRGCEWLAHSWLSATLRASRWGFAVGEMAHLLALAAVGGGVLLLALCAGGRILQDRPLHGLVRDFAPWIAGGLVMSVASGVLLFADGPLRYYANVAFRTKLVLFGCALGIGLLVLRAAKRAAAGSAAAASMRAAVLIDALLWLGVGIAGRAIGIL